jgi:hypothetical protein
LNEDKAIGWLYLFCVSFAEFRSVIETCGSTCKISPDMILIGNWITFGLSPYPYSDSEQLPSWLT